MTTSERGVPSVERDHEQMPWPGDLANAVGLLAFEADKLEWLALKDTPGYRGVDIPGVFLKFFGEANKGPWAYLVRHDPGTIVGRHSHNGNVIHYLLEGSWKLGSQEKGPGWFHYEQKGLRYGPIISGPQGSLFLAIYDAEPDFIPAE
ncbi:MAG: cupin domain-containing protein [Candidatus Rokuibacteriota bacterium]